MKNLTKFSTTIQTTRRGNLNPLFLLLLPVGLILLGLVVLFLAYQAHPYEQTVDIGTPYDADYVAGFYPEEHNPDFNFRWSRKESFVNTTYPGSPYTLTFRAAAPRPDNQPVELVVVTNGQEIGRVAVTGQPQVFSIRSGKIIWGPEELALTFRPSSTFAEPGGRPQLGVAFDWVRVASAKNGFGLTLPPPFTLFWWLLLALAPLLLSYALGLPVLTGAITGFGTLLLGSILYLFPESSTYLRTNLIITGLQILLIQVVLAAALCLFFPRRFLKAYRLPRFTRSPGFWLFTLLLLFYLSTARGYLSYGDDQIMLAVSANFAAGKPASPIDPYPPDPAASSYHSKYGLGQSLVATPFYMAGDAFSRLFPFMFSEKASIRGLTTYVTLFTGPLVTALAALVMYWTVLLLGYKRWIAFTMGLLLGVGTMAWHYARTFLSEPLVMLCLVTVLASTLAYLKSGKLRWPALAGFAAGLAVAARSFNLVIVPILFASLFFIWWKGKQNYRQGLKLFLAAAIPLAFWLILVAWWNWARFGNPLQTGYGGELDTGFSTPVLEGVYGLLFSPGKSIFLYNPVLLLGIMGLPGLWRNKYGRITVFMIGTTSLSYLLLYGAWYVWYGGGVWGPRFLAPLLPLLLLPGAAVLEVLSEVDWRKAAPQRVRAFLLAGITALLVMASFLVQILSVVVSYQIYTTQTARDNNLFWQSIYNLSYSPLLKDFELWQQQARPDFAPRFYHDTPFARFVSFFQSSCWQLVGLVLVFGLLVWWAKSREKAETGDRFTLWR